ncbi:unnamed protein product [Hermetia illucens]|uniref:Uncharacterized protein n=1 Tax=Hermetia illucens TaxID=343691 RepID=A0A7R8UDN4_HERIL|nr:unnamed protein product [Hermetia illucens]
MEPTLPQRIPLRNFIYYTGECQDDMEDTSPEVAIDSPSGMALLQDDVGLLPRCGVPRARRALAGTSYQEEFRPALEITAANSISSALP